MGVRDDLRAMPRAAWILFAGTLINRFGNFVLPFLVLYLTRNGYTVAQAGLAIGAYGVGHLISAIAGGHLADRIGRRNTIAVSMFGSAVAMVALSQTRGFGAIVIVTCITGIFAELYRPAGAALISDLVPGGERVFAFGLHRFAVNLGVAAGPAMAGFVAERSFLALFLVDAATSLLYGIIALVALPHGVRTRRDEEKPGEAMRFAARDRPFMLFLAAVLGVALVDFQIGSTYPLYVTSLGYSTRVFGALVSLNGLLVVLFELWITSYTKRLRPLPVIAVGFALNNFGFALTGLAHTIPALAATMLIWTFGEMFSSPMGVAFVAEIAPERYRGRYMGLFTLMYSIGLIVGPAAGTFLYQHDPRWLWWTGAVLGLISALLLWLTSAAVERAEHH